MKRLLKKLVPEPDFRLYHWILAYLAALVYSFPSEKMVVIGVTGTNGKSTTCNLIARILGGAGLRVGMATTVNFKVAEREWLNDTKMTMLGRFRLQRLLREMVRAGCSHAVVETSSEGIKQYRHAGINYDVAVFTNLTPEHLESHGGLENYKRAKGQLFAKLGADRVKTLKGKRVDKFALVNLRDPHADYFLGRSDVEKWGFFAALPGVVPQAVKKNPARIVTANGVSLLPDGSSFSVDGIAFNLNMSGGYNVENALAAAVAALTQGVTLEESAKALSEVKGIPGRMEFIDEGQPFKVLVDYAPEPESLGKLYGAIGPRLSVPGSRLIHVLGSCGGGRDRARRPILGKMAGERADIVIVSNEDPYDDDPMAIIREVAEGAKSSGKIEGKDLFLILDRTEALAKAVSLAGPGDMVLATGKGAEQAICVANGKKITWDERTQLRQIIRKSLAGNATNH
jgi:UDP-N-acetylmuramoyl-L-alanyl-D-glutamate--2,6-diaminopimelate ligase